MSDDFTKRRSWGPKPSYPSVESAMPYTGGMISVMGPCSVESEPLIDKVARSIAGLGTNPGSYLRGGIWKAGTYPPPEKDFGLKMDRLRWLSQAGKDHGLKVVAEVIDVRHISRIDRYVDAFQVGARQGQGYTLLSELASQRKPVFLKRGAGMKLDELLGAAEYLARGRCQTILVERGGASHLDHVRWELSISLIAAAKRITGLPVIVDASHGTGRRDLVAPMTFAGIAAGADGFLLECHPCPTQSWTDADQSYPLADASTLYRRALELYGHNRLWAYEDNKKGPYRWTPAGIKAGRE